MSETRRSHGDGSGPQLDPARLAPPARDERRRRRPPRPSTSSSSSAAVPREAGEELALGQPPLRPLDRPLGDERARRRAQPIGRPSPSSLEPGAHAGSTSSERQTGARVAEHASSAAACVGVSSGLAHRPSSTAAKMLGRDIDDRQVDTARGGGELTAAARPRLATPVAPHRSRRRAPRRAAAPAPRRAHPRPGRRRAATARSAARRVTHDGHGMRVRALRPLLPEQPPGVAKRVRERRAARERDRRAAAVAASARLEVGRSATVASATPLLKATSDDAVAARRRVLEQARRRDPSPARRAGRRAASSCCRRRSRPRTATRCSRTLRRTSSGVDRHAARARGLPAPPPRAASRRPRRPRRPAVRAGDASTSLAAATTSERSRRPIAPRSCLSGSRAVRDHAGRRRRRPRRSPGRASSSSTAGVYAGPAGPAAFFRSPPGCPTSSTSSRIRAQEPVVDAGVGVERVGRHAVAEREPRRVEDVAPAPRRRARRARRAPWRTRGSDTSARWLTTPTAHDELRDRAVDRLADARRGERAARAASTARRASSPPRPEPARTPSGSSPNASRRRSTSARAAASAIASTTTCRPIRSAICGRSSPSSGFIVPTSRNRAGCEIDTPSRSTTLTPAPRRRAARRRGGRRGG